MEHKHCTKGNVGSERLVPTNRCNNEPEAVTHAPGFNAHNCKRLEGVGLPNWTKASKGNIPFVLSYTQSGYWSRYFVNEAMGR